MRLATWNVNSLRVRQEQVLNWLASSEVDVLCLQELKMEQVKFPLEAFTERGYHCAVNGQKTYNGVAIISRHPLENVALDIPNYDDIQKRVVAATILGVRVICGYFPNGQSLESDKYRYKQDWLDAMQAYVKSELALGAPLALLGDYNIAPTDDDVHDPQRADYAVLTSPKMRAVWQSFIDMGLADCFRHFPQAPKSYSWWDYRTRGFARNHGLRIDHILVSQSLLNACRACVIDTVPRGWQQASDHTPVLADFAEPPY